VVVVSVTHRLALLGFLDLEGIAGEEFAGSTNASMLDLVAALAWVRDNIASFGGDPGRVTIMGHSGGGGKVATLAAMPAARGLIHRAVVLGGPPFGMHHRSDALESAELALHDLGLTAATAGEIRGMPVERLLETQLRLGVGGAPGPHGMRFSPVAGTADLPVDSYTAFAAGVAADVPFIIGTAVDEAHLVLFARPELADDARDLDRDALVRAVAPGLGDPGQAGDLVDRYRARHPERSLARLFLDIHSDQFRIRSTRLAAARLAGGADATWIYSADVGHDGMPGSYHGIEVPFFFHTLVEADEDPAAGHAPAATEPRRRLQDAVAADLAAFASDGVPGSGQSWPRYGLAEPRQVLLSDDGAVHRLERYATDVDELWHGVPAPITTDPWTTLF
jgi:para-nitrobenzyl esterase